MKPIPQNSERSFPLTDYNFQATTEVRTGSSSLFPAKKPRSFRDLSSEFFAAEANRNYLAELFLFTLITAVSAWPIISMIAALAHMIR